MSSNDKRRRLGSSVLGELGRLARSYGVQKIPINEIDLGDSKFRTRYDLGEKQIAELSESIRSEGLINPVVVRRRGDSRYQLISGFRRVEAVRKLGEEAIDAIVVSVDDDKAFRMAVSENLKRKSLTPIELGLMCDRLVKEGRSYDEVGRLMGLSAKQIQRYLRTLKLSEDVKRSLAKGEINFFTALEIGKLDDAVQSGLLKRVLKEALSTREVAQLVRDMRKSEGKSDAIEGLPNVRFKKGLVIIKSTGDDLTKTLRILLNEAEKGTIQEIIA
ncbi:MAG: ParB/RepB/Spo0J family partition protein [Promethearchaeati archaeon SRVP18_Atabeyarchaeia-1]